MKPVSDAALRNAEPRDDARKRECERGHVLLIQDAKHGLGDIVAGRTVAADAALAKLQHRRHTAVKMRG